MILFSFRLPLKKHGCLQNGLWYICILKIYLYSLLKNIFSDPRTASWPLIGSPIPIAIILGVYLYFVNNFGPKMMKDRKPFQLRELMLLYNAGQVFICSYIVYKVSRSPKVLMINKMNRT